MTHLESRIAELIETAKVDHTFVALNKLKEVAVNAFPTAVALAHEVINTCCNCQSWTPDDPCGDPKCRLARELMASIERELDAH